MNALTPHDFEPTPWVLYVTDSGPWILPAAVVARLEKA